jgi:hypothetical protein
MTLSEPIQGAPAKYIKGRERFELVNDLAMGDMTQEQLAVKYDRSRIAISQFAVRNKAEIQEAKDEIYGPFWGSYHAKKGNRIAQLERWIAIHEHDLETDELSWKARVDLTARLQKLVNAIAEELGDLPTRTQVTVDASKLTQDIVGFDREKWLQEAQAKRQQAEPQ